MRTPLYAGQPPKVSILAGFHSQCSWEMRLHVTTVFCLNKKTAASHPDWDIYYRHLHYSSLCVNAVVTKLRLMESSTQTMETGKRVHVCIKR